MLFQSNLNMAILGEHEYENMPKLLLSLYNQPTKIPIPLCSMF